MDTTWLKTFRISSVISIHYYTDHAHEIIEKNLLPTILREWNNIFMHSLVMIDAKIMTEVLRINHAKIHGRGSSH